jgi:hypothetical protein
MPIKDTAKKTAKEFNEQLRITFSAAIITALSLLAAFTWKDLFAEYMGTLNTISALQSQIIQAVIITIVAGFGILLATKIKPKEK